MTQQYGVVSEANFRDQRIGDLIGFRLLQRGQPRGNGFGPRFSGALALTVHTRSRIHAWPDYACTFAVGI